MQQPIFNKDITRSIQNVPIYSLEKCLKMVPDTSYCKDGKFQLTQSEHENIRTIRDCVRVLCVFQSLSNEMIKTPSIMHFNRDIMKHINACCELIESDRSSNTAKKSFVELLYNKSIISQFFRGVNVGVNASVNVGVSASAGVHVDVGVMSCNIIVHVSDKILYSLYTGNNYVISECSKFSMIVNKFSESCFGHECELISQCIERCLSILASNRRLVEIVIGNRNWASFINNLFCVFATRRERISRAANRDAIITEIIVEKLKKDHTQ